uniref:Ubiquitin-like domain-containing protein n=1 Tax=Compsopogon caeruleus TaxID=31354 RepID=A0A7S1THJ9_9RHOD|mmetsp:Transcript_7225/g.14857  ORF Transcript_7225/g.14857 Transcript_7225/m.14857 type:complete len:328 (+) Transcript_7225:60-1043(+)
MSDFFVARVKRPVTRSLLDVEEDEEKGGASEGDGGLIVVSDGEKCGSGGGVIEVSEMEENCTGCRDGGGSAVRRSTRRSRHQRNVGMRRKKARVEPSDAGDWELCQAAELRKAPARKLLSMLEMDDEDEFADMGGFGAHPQTEMETGSVVTALRDTGLTLRVRIDNVISEYKVTKGDMLENLYQLVAERGKVTRSAVRLEWDGLPLNPLQSVTEAEMEEGDLIDGSFIRVAEPKPQPQTPQSGSKSGTIQVHVTVIGSRKKTAYTVRSTDKIRKVVDHVSLTRKVPAWKILPIYQGTNLDPDSPFDDAGIFDGSLMRIRIMEDPIVL